MISCLETQTKAGRNQTVHTYSLPRFSIFSFTRGSIERNTFCTR